MFYFKNNLYLFKFFRYTFIKLNANKMGNNYLKDFLKSVKIIILLISLFGISLGNAQNRKMQVSLNINLKVDTTRVRLYDLNSANDNENIKTVVLKNKNEPKGINYIFATRNVKRNYC